MPQNDGYAFREQLGPDADGSRLVDYLARRYRHTSVAVWEARVAEGRVLLDGAPAGPEARLRRGQEVVWNRPPWNEPDAPTAFEILHDDGDLLAVAKPAGLPTLPGAGFQETTLLEQVRLVAPGAAPVHRLGRFTSGIVLFARSAGARAELTRQWALQTVGKRYRALASGNPEQDELTIMVPIGRVPHPLLGTVHAASPAGKASRSDVTVVARGSDAFLCDVAIRTGRPHQIRIHLAAAGHPLAGDPLYIDGGGVAPDTRAVPGDPGYLLHAAELTFRHPADGRAVVIESLPPEALRAPLESRRPESPSVSRGERPPPSAAPPGSSA